jgi:hypothetical protein
MPLTVINVEECSRASVCRFGFVQVGFPSCGLVPKIIPIEASKNPPSWVRIGSAILETKVLT